MLFADELFPRWRVRLVFFVFGFFARALVQTATRRVLRCFLERLLWSLLLWFRVIFHLIINGCIKHLSVGDLSAVWVLFWWHLFNWLFVKLGHVDIGPACEALRNGRFFDYTIASNELFWWVDTLITFTFVVAAKVNTLRPLILESLLRLLVLFLSRFFRRGLAWLRLLFTIDPNWLLLVVIYRYCNISSSFTCHSRLVRNVWDGMMLLSIRFLHWDHVGLHWGPNNTLNPADEDGGILISERLWNAFQNLWSTRESRLAGFQVW